MIKISLLARPHRNYHRHLRLSRYFIRERSVHLPVRYSAVFMAALFFLVSCNDEEPSSAFDDILSQPPYVSLTDSIQDQPKNDELYFKRAVLLNKNNFPEPALADFQKAWSLKHHEKYAFGIANVLVAKKPDSATIFLNEAIKLLPESYLLRITLARSYNEQNKTEEALKVCEEILTLQPDQLDMLVLKSELLEKEGDLRASVVPLERAHQLLPANMEIAFKLAYKYAEAKDPKVISFCDSLIKKDTLKMTAEPYYVKGVYYSNIDDKPKAIQLFNETLKHDYNHLNAYIEKGKILIGLKKMAEALKVFQLANTLSLTFPDAYYWMGVCQEALGQKEEAKLSYEKAYSLDKTFTEAKEASERLAK